MENGLRVSGKLWSLKAREFGGYFSVLDGSGSF